MKVIIELDCDEYSRRAIGNVINKELASHDDIHKLILSVIDVQFEEWSKEYDYLENIKQANRNIDPTLFRGNI